MRVPFSSSALAAVAAITLVPAVPAQVKPPDFTPPTPLIAAIMSKDTAEAKRLLAAGANPNEGTLIGATPLLLAVMQGEIDAARALIAKGADVKAVDMAGSSTLMWASYEKAEPAFVKELLALGLDPNAKNKQGDNALTWAMKRGHTPVVELLRQNGGDTAPLIRGAVEKAIALLQKSGPEFTKGAACASCHHQSLPQMANGHARQRGYAVDATVSEQQVKAVMAMYRPWREQMLKGMPGLPDPPITVSYALLGLAAEGYQPDETTAAMAHLVAANQKADGSFKVVALRPPMESSPITGVALSIRALQIYGKDPEDADRIRRATNWLRSAKAVTTEERTMQLMGLAWAKALGSESKAGVKALLSEQRPDGGWAQLPNLETDAYATGQALVALQAAGVKPSDMAFRKGIDFLLRTQRPDGSWLVRSRSFPFQPYRETGFPYGKDQWISAAGTSWAAMALSLAETQAPTGQQQISQAR